MRKFLFGTAALVLSLVALGSVSPQRAEAQQKGGGVSLDLKLDLNQAVNDITRTIGAAKDRGAFVRALLEEVKSKTGGNLNIMVFNMQQNFDFNPPPNTFQFTQTTFNGGLAGNITYGVWVFNSAVTFTNRGDGGFINWAFFGVFTRNGGTVTFQAR
jgi:hypothetical protein